MAALWLTKCYCMGMKCIWPFLSSFFKTNKQTKTAKTTAWSFKNKLCIHLLYTVYAPCKNCAYNQKAVQLSHTCSVTFPKCVVDVFLCVRFQTDYSHVCFPSLTLTCENGFIRTAVRPDKLKLSTNSCCAANFLRIRWGVFSATILPHMDHTAGNNPLWALCTTGNIYRVVYGWELSELNKQNPTSHTLRALHSSHAALLVNS